jgi:hypothetical protein
MLSACCGLDRHRVLKSLVTSRYDRVISGPSTTNSMYTCAQHNAYSSRDTDEKGIVLQSIEHEEQKQRKWEIEIAFQG